MDAVFPMEFIYDRISGTPKFKEKFNMHQENIASKKQSELYLRFVLVNFQQDR